MLKRSFLHFLSILSILFTCLHCVPDVKAQDSLPPSPMLTYSASPESSHSSISTDFELSPEEMAEIKQALEKDASTFQTDLNPEAKAQNNTSGFNSLIQNMNPDIAFILNVALAYFSQEKHYQTGGHDPSETGFNFQQLEMSLGASVDHYFRLDANLVFSLYGVEIEEAYLTTLELPGNLQLRAGQFLTRFGRLNPTHPHTWDFIDQPFVLGKFFGSEANRGLGLELSWLTPLPWYLEIVASATMATGNSTHRSYLQASEQKITGFSDFLYTVAIKQFFPITEHLGLQWGVTGQWGPNDSGYQNRTEIYGTDIYLKINPKFINHAQMYFAFQAEELVRIRQIPGDSLVDHAGYVTFLWQINREWNLGVRGEWGSGVKQDPLDPDWTQYRGRTSIETTFAGSHFSKIRAQLNIDIPRWEKHPHFIAFLGVELLIGAHKAHSY